MQKILGVDPGSLKTGFGILEIETQGNIRHVSHGTIFLSPKKNVEERLSDLAIDLQMLIEKYKPTLAVVEDLFFHKHPRSALVLGQARGCVLAVLGLHKIDIENISPTEAKSLIVGHGRAKKFQMKKFVALELGIAEPKSDDASDALALALALAHKGQKKDR